LRAKIDKRILFIMIFTYFIQALDKGTLSFASIMGIQADAKLKGQEYAWLTTGVGTPQLSLGIPETTELFRHVLKFFRLSQHTHDAYADILERSTSPFYL